MLKLGMVGWRGMVGSVLMDRMKQEDDFKFVSTTFFSTSNAGGKAPEVPNSDPILKDADDLDALAACDVVISCQGGDWTKAHFKPLPTKAGTATGLTLLPRCVWKRTPSLFSTL